MTQKRGFQVYDDSLSQNSSCTNIWNNKQYLLIIMLEDQSLSEQPHSIRQSSGVPARATNIQAYLFATMSSVSIVIMQIVLKQVTKHFLPTLVLGFRGSVLFLFNLMYLTYTNTGIHVQDPIIFKAIIKRSLASATTVILYLGSVKYIPIGVANALFNTTPIMTFFVELVYYKKVVFRWFNLLVIVISFIGVLLIIQPPILFGGEVPQNYFYYFVVLGSAVAASFSMIFLHDLRGKATELVVLQHGYFIQTNMAFLFYLTMHPDDTQSISYLHSLNIVQIFKLVVYVILMVIFSFSTQYFQAKALFLCKPALVLPFSYFSVILGFVLDTLVFNAQYNGLMVLGMVMASGGLFSKFIALYFDDDQKKQAIKNEGK